MINFADIRFSFYQIVLKNSWMFSFKSYSDSYIEFILTNPIINILNKQLNDKIIINIDKFT